MEPPERKSPLTFATLDELLAELRKRCDSLCLGIVPKMGPDRPNEDGTTIIEGKPQEMAWLAMLIQTNVQMQLMHFQKPEMELEEEEAEEEDSDEP